MKNLSVIVVTFSFFGLVLCSCQKDDNNDETQTPEIKSENISAKWDVVGEVYSIYKSFEFNASGNYVVTLGDDTFKFGSYVIDGRSTIDLVNFGRISVTDITAEKMEFTVTTDKEYQVIANKSAEMPLTNKTTLLCRTWQMYSIDGELTQGTDDDLTVLFSAAGTYLVTWTSDPENGGLASWQWSTDNQNSICYSWDGNPACTGDNAVDITTLTTSQLIMVEDEIEFILVPGNETKMINRNTGKGSQGFFGR